jgi:AGCS family alanine or glycine:cation symporter
MTVLRIGAARGVFTNEAGMGTASIAHSTANVAHPAQQGLMGIMEVFLDTIVICTMTALVILTSGVEIPYGIDGGALLTTRAFSATYGRWVCIPMATFLSVFAVATILGWSFYGLQCITYLMGESGKFPYLILQAIAAMLGALWETADIWTISELLNGLMAIPNLIALLMLRNTVIQLTKEFIRAEHRKQASDRNLPEGSK